MNDFLKQLEQMSKLGGVGKLMSKLPGTGGMADAIKNQVSLLNNGVDQVSSPINSEFVDESFTGFFRYGRTFKKLKFNASVNINQSMYTNLVNGRPNTAENLSQNYRVSFSSNFKSAPNLELGYQKSFNKFTSQKSTTDRPFARLDGRPRAPGAGTADRPGPGH